MFKSCVQNSGLGLSLRVGVENSVSVLEDSVTFNITGWPRSVSVSFQFNCHK